MRPTLDDVYEILAVDSDDCIIWPRAKDKDGYGQKKYLGKQWKAHRLVYLLVKGHFPDELLVCHSCDNPSCVNYKHLFVGTQSDNKQDEVRKGRNIFTNKTHCPNGHLYDSANTAITKEGWRKCRACDRERHNEKYLGYKASNL
jgi:hypothetical protein